MFRLFRIFNLKRKTYFVEIWMFKFLTAYYELRALFAFRLEMTHSLSERDPFCRFNSSIHVAMQKVIWNTETHERLLIYFWRNALRDPLNRLKVSGADFRPCASATHRLTRVVFCSRKHSGIYSLFTKLIQLFLLLERVKVEGSNC